DDPFELRGPEFGAPTDITPENWLASVKQQVVTQYNLIKQNPGMSGFAAAFSAPVTITGTAKIFEIALTDATFNGQMVIKFSTDGKFLAVGKLNFADGLLRISSKLYADLSKISQGAATVLFLADIPDNPRIYTLYGKLKMGFRNAQGDQVAFKVPETALTNPTASLVGPSDGGTVAVGDINGRGYLDVSYTVPATNLLNQSSITDIGTTGDEFTISTPGVTRDQTPPPLPTSTD